MASLSWFKYLFLKQFLFKREFPNLLQQSDRGLPINLVNSWASGCNFEKVGWNQYYERLVGRSTCNVWNQKDRI